MKAILARSVVYRCSCISRASEQWRRNPLQSSTKPGQGAGRAMGLATTASEGVVVVFAEIGIVNRTMRNIVDLRWMIIGSLLSYRCRRSWMTDAGWQMEAHTSLVHAHTSLVRTHTHATRKHRVMRCWRNSERNDVGEKSLEYNVGDKSQESGR